MQVEVVFSKLRAGLGGSVIYFLVVIPSYIHWETDWYIHLPGNCALPAVNLTLASFGEVCGHGSR